MVYIPETDEIYFRKSKEYFNEVLSNYSNGCYRSAIVMLYSVVICDLLFKLKEVSDMYNDTIAAEILKEVEKCKNSADNKSKSRWEKEFVDNVFYKTVLLDLESYTMINHLYDYRNFSAHPALNDNYELIAPSKEIAIALIKNVLEKILVTPPFFVKKVTDTLLIDLAEKQSIYMDNLDKLQEYLKRKYFDRMSVSMKKNLFRSFWKLCFCLPEDEECKRNLKINRKAMEFLYYETDDILDYMKTDTMFSNTAPDDNCLQHLCLLLAHIPQIYDVLSEDTKLQISSLIEKNNSIRIISWFKSNNKKHHMMELIKSSNFGNVPNNVLGFVTNEYMKSGDISYFIDYCIEYFGKSISFDQANERYYYAVKRFLSIMSHEQFVRLIEVVNANGQIYNRNANFSTNTEIATSALPILGAEFDYSKYPHFTFDTARITATLKDDSCEDADSDSDSVWD